MSANDGINDESGYMPYRRELDELHTQAIEAANRRLGKQPGTANIYHYTDCTGALGIVSSAALWATMATHLNDAREIGQGLIVADQVLGSLALEFPEWASTLEVVRSQNADLSLAGFQVFVVSFSELRDDLSQWRAYSSQNGYCLGVDSVGLRNRTENLPSWELRPCLYEELDQHDLIESAVRFVLPHLEPPSQHADPGQGQAWAVIYRTVRAAAAQIKDSAFAAEREWRLVNNRAMTLDHFRFRPGPRGITPYVVFPLGRSSEDSDFVGFSDVVLAPGSDVIGVESIMAAGHSVVAGRPGLSAAPYLQR